METIKSIEELKFDDHNFNKHTEEGKKLLAKSLQHHKFGRSILVDKDNNIIAGNGIVETAKNLGMDKIKVVETTGEELVVVKRTDVDINTKEGREMALADNATSAADLSWNEEELALAEQMWNVDVNEWNVDALSDYDESEFGDEFSLADGDKNPYQQMALILADEQAEYLMDKINEVGRSEEYRQTEFFGNQQKKGNAIYLIVRQWEELKKLS